MEGKVKSLTKFGAFVALPDGSTGMVHISEIAHAYVNDIREHLTEGQDVKVMIILNGGAQRNPGQSGERASAPRQAGASASQPQQKSFDDMLKQFMTESSSKMSSIKQYSEHKTKTRRR